MDDFSVKTERNGLATVVTIAGRVDSVTAATLDDALGKIARENKRIVLDMKSVTYLSSAGVRAILKVSQSAQKSGGGVRLAKIPTRVAEVLENVGVIYTLKPFPSVEAAVSDF